MEEVPCPLCGCISHKVLFRRKDHTHKVNDFSFSVVRCKKCNFVFINPRPSQEEIHEYYPNDFYSIQLTPDELLLESKERNEAKLGLIRHIPPGRLLDIGCQKGEFLYEACKRGWDVCGLEFSKKPPNLFQLPIFHGPIENSTFEEASFDLITLWAVLEHVHDPVLMMRHIRKLIKPTGRVLILIPNFNSLPARLMRHDDVPRHLLMFTPKTFKALCSQTGFKIAKIIFGDSVFSGSNRGTLNFLYKLLRGEKLDDIVAQNREPGRWNEFANTINGRNSDFMLKIDRLDIKLTPILDKIANNLGYGFIMTIELII